MRVVATLLSMFLFSVAVFADHPTKPDDRKAVLLDGLGPIHHPVSTKNEEAQKFFDQVWH